MINYSYTPGDRIVDITEDAVQVETDGMIFEMSVGDLFESWLEYQCLDEEYLEENSNRKKWRHHSKALEDRCKIAAYYRGEERKYEKGETDSDRRHRDAMRDMRDAVGREISAHQWKLDSLREGKKIARAKAINKKGGYQSAHRGLWDWDEDEANRRIKEAQATKKNEDRYLGKNRY